jgi:multiple sugar transport system permease protein
MKFLFSTAIRIVLFFSVICSAQAGWIEDTDDGTVIHVKVSRLPDPTRIDPASRAAFAAMKAFRRSFPDIFRERYMQKYEQHPELYGHHNWSNVTIQLEQFTGIRVEGVESDLLAIAGGMAPDVLYVNFRKSDNYIMNNFLYPLDDYFATLNEEEIENRINPKLWPVIRRKGPNGEQHIWALPYDGALGKVLLYRKDLFEEKNIPLPTPQWTWDDMLSAARKLTDPAKGTYGIFLRRGKHESWYWLTFLWSAGGEVIVYDEINDQWRCTFDSRQAAVALDFYTTLSAEKWIDQDGSIRRGYSAKDASAASTKWNRGEIGMMLSYIDEKVFANINPEVTGMIPVPIGPTGKRGGELNSKMMGLFSEINQPAVRDAAWEYMRFFDSLTAMKIKTEIMVESGLGQFVNPKYLKRFGYDEIVRLAPKHLSETFQTAIETGRPEPYGRNSNFAYELMTEPIATAEQMALNDELPQDREARLDVLQKLLISANRRANEIMMGEIPERERAKRRIAAALMLVVIAVSVILSWRRIARAFTPPSTSLEKFSLVRHMRRFIWAYILLLPATAALIVWKYIPLARGAGMAFYDYRLIGESVFTGLDNFGNMLFDSFWWNSIFNAFRYSFLIIALTFAPPIILALMLHEIPVGKRLFRFIYYLPAVVSGLVTMILWKQFYEPSENGTLNAILLNTPSIVFLLLAVAALAIAILFARRLQFNDASIMALVVLVAGMLVAYTILKPTLPMIMPENEKLIYSLAHLPRRLFLFIPEPVRWLGNPETAMTACVIPMIWAGMGPGCLIYLAALKCIPEEYYEAADMDGAGFIDKILFVVIPQLKMLILINFIGTFITSWYSAAGNILVMTGGGSDTEVAGLHIWYKAFTFLQFGPATAMAWMLGFILIGFTVQQLTMLSKVEFKTANKV